MASVSYPTPVRIPLVSCRASHGGFHDNDEVPLLLSPTMRSEGVRVAASTPASVATTILGYSPAQTYVFRQTAILEHGREMAATDASGDTLASDIICSHSSAKDQHTLSRE